MSLIRLTEVAGEFETHQRVVYVNSAHIVRFCEGTTYRSRSVVDAPTSLVRLVTGDVLTVLDSPEEISTLIAGEAILG
jgi:hypothetical protein